MATFLKVIAFILILGFGGLGILYVTDSYSPETLIPTASKFGMVMGILTVMGLLVTVLARSKKTKSGRPKP